jgi:phospholipid/cholesterol/gamma-HCH transport system substrate-binding protein
MEESDMYKAQFEETVSGLEIGAQVKYNGVRVGQVAGIKINPQKIDQITVLLELDEGTPVKTDTVAILTSMGITGLKFVELTGGSDETALMQPGGTIRAGHSFMGSMEGKAEDIAVKVELAVSKINALLSEKNIAHFNDILLNLKGFSQNANELLDENNGKITAITDDLTRVSKDLERTMASAERSSGTVEEILLDSRPKVAAVLTNVNQTTNTIRETVKRIAEVDGILKRLENTLSKFNAQIKAVDLGKLAGGVQSVVNETDATIRSVRRIIDASRENIFESSESLKTTMRNLEDVSSELRDQPSLLLRSKPPEDRTPKERTGRQER